MVPKIIHSFWGGEKNIHKYTYFDNWKNLEKYGYEINVVTEKDIDKSVCEYVEYTYNKKYWAHLSDYIRFDLLYKYGGIWVDADVIIHKLFDDLLSLDYIIAKSNINYNITRENIFVYEPVYPASFLCLSIMGLSKNHKISKIVKDYYDSLNFNKRYFDLNDNMIGIHVYNSFLENNIKVDYETYLKFDKNTIPIDEILKNEINNPSIIYSLPAVMFDLKINQRIHKNQYTSHMHHAMWT